MSEEILKLIETVDPSDTAKLDEIDLKVCKYQTRYDFEGSLKLVSAPQYTRSRDALKQIRPDGWGIQIFGNSHSGEPAKYKDLEYSVQLIRDNPYSCKTSPDLSTEELAELHAILQAIDFDRSKK